MHFVQINILMFLIYILHAPLIFQDRLNDHRYRFYVRLLVLLIKTISMIIQSVLKNQRGIPVYLNEKHQNIDLNEMHLIH